MRIIVAEDSALLREGLVRLLEEVGHTVLSAVDSAPALLRAVDEANKELLGGGALAQGLARTDDSPLDNEESAGDAPTGNPTTTNDFPPGDGADTSNVGSREKSTSGTGVDFVITDVRMPPTNTDDGLRAAVSLRQSYPDVKILVLSAYVEKAYARELFADGRGGVGYLLKDRISNLTTLNEFIERIAGGGTVIDPEVVSQMLVHSPTSALERLTARESQVLGLIAQGLSNQAICSTLYLSEGAVEKHISSVFAKLDLPPDAGAHRRVQAVLAWLQR